jgi:hypothetical protein
VRTKQTPTAITSPRQTQTINAKQSHCDGTNGDGLLLRLETPPPKNDLEPVLTVCDERQSKRGDDVVGVSVDLRTHQKCVMPSFKLSSKASHPPEAVAKPRHSGRPRPVVASAGTSLARSNDDSHNDRMAAM